jgi:hypothetical protein
MFILQAPATLTPEEKSLVNRRLSGPPEVVSTLIAVKDKVVPAYTMKGGGADV